MPILTGRKIRTRPPLGLVSRAATIKEGNLMIERALTKTIADIAPPPAKAAAFRWILKPSGGTFRGRVYSDGTGSTGQPSC